MINETKKDEVQRLIETLLKTDTPTSIAAKLGVTTATLWRWGTGRSKPHERELKSMRKMKKDL